MSEAPKKTFIASTDVAVTARAIDFVTRFDRNWEHLRAIMGIMNPIKKAPGAVLRSKYVVGTLEDTVEEGKTIPLSHYEVKEKDYTEMGVEKYAKAVTLEAIKEHGYENAVQLTDDEFLYQLQSSVTDKFYTYLNTGSLHPATGKIETFQMALAMAKGLVSNKFKTMHRAVTEVVGFVNTLDVYEYLGSANITVQTAFGFEYIKNFMGYSTIFLLSDEEIARGRVIATPVENINLYYVDPAESDFARAGLSYTTSGETNLIGVHIQGNYSNATSETYAIMGMTLFAEYVDGIAVIDLNQTYA